MDEVEWGAESAAFTGGDLAVDRGSWAQVVLVGFGVAAGVVLLVVLGAVLGLVADASHGSGFSS
jgi:uncharacterized membrane protein